MLREMEYVLAVYREQSFSKAAQKLFISQPALSTKVKRAEEQIGTNIFDRSTNPIQVTSAGKCYIEAAEQIMDIQNDLQHKLSELISQRAGSLTIGSSTYFCSYVLPQLALEFHELHPQYTVNLLEGNTGDLTQCLLSGVVDLTLDVDAMDLTLFEAYSLGQEQIVLAVPANLEINQKLQEYSIPVGYIWGGNILEAHCPKVELSLFADEQFLLLKRGNDMHKRALKLCRNAGFQPKVKMYLDQMLTSYHVAANGHGIAFIRKDIIQHVKWTDQLCFYMINDKDVYRDIMLYHKKDSELPPVVQAFLQFMKKRNLNQL